MLRIVPNAFRLSLKFACLGLLSLSAGLPAQAQITTDLSFQAPPVGSPGNREAGSGRSDTCVALTEQAGLTALVPDTNVGLTTQSSPQLFAYVPSNSAEFAELRLIKESSSEEIYVAEVQMPRATASEATHTYQSAVLSLALPSSVSLEPGENYLWALMLVCNSDNRAEDIVVTAVVQRADATYLNTLSASVAEQLNAVESAPDNERLIAYSAAGLWQDLLAELSSLVERDPAIYEPVWNDLLTEQGLGAVASVPLYESALTVFVP